MIRGIILAGGSGKRLWPLSRNDYPKQLLKIGTKKTLIEESIDRLTPIVDSVTISTGTDLAPLIKNIVPSAKMIVEPARRDTAAAIGLCATQFDLDDVLVFTPSDAYISPAKEFQNTIKNAINLAEKGIVVVGIKSNNPATGYGYIECGKDNSVISFKEKPSKELALSYMKKGYLWNAGIFVVKAGTLLTLFKEHAPMLYSGLIKIKETNDLGKIYPELEKISFDFAVMEKAKNVFFVPSNFYWNDIGAFSAMYDILKEPNAVLGGDVVSLDSKGNVIHSNKLVALIDCDDLVVIDTNDALLVCKKSSAEKVKQLVENHVHKDFH